VNDDRRKFLQSSIGALGPLGFRARGVDGAEPLAEAAHRLLRALRSPLLDSFLAAWPMAGAERRPIEPSSVPMLRYLPGLASGARPFCFEFAGKLENSSSRLAWRRSYTATQVGESFLENYGWAELVGLTGETASEQLACGVLLLGPNTTYPPHRHEAEEVYVPLAGRALWQRGDGLFAAEAESAVIHHAPFEPHAMRTEASPLLALYLWRSQNLAQKSQLMPTAR
jgi:mannose-6-phosphate isomerase-like protein (cupin superfamily)